MTTVFVSSCHIDAPHAAALVARLRAESFSVLHSPRNPSDGEDARWREWYARGCREEIEQASIFITVVSYAWDCSTWMASEADAASKLMDTGKIREMYFWNPEQIEVRARGMLPYLKKGLPDNVDELVRVLKAQ